MDVILNWLQSGPPWISYMTRIDLCNESASSREIVQLKNQITIDLRIIAFINDLRKWPGDALKSHKNVHLLIHKLSFLAEIGFTYKDNTIKEITGQIMEHQSEEGPFEICINIPTHFGGTGKDEYAWTLCDAPIIISSLLKFGLLKNRAVNKAISYSNGLIRENGWPCAGSAKIGKFRGPGKKADPCPYATLQMLKVLAYHPELLDCNESRIGTECLLSLWEKRKEYKPYLFAMGTDFKKLKAPLMWYDILHVTDVLSHFPWVRKDIRFKEMLDIIINKQTKDGLYTAESIYRGSKEWEFGQKKEPSRWITFLVNRIKKRVGI